MGSYKVPSQALGILPQCFLPIYDLFLPLLSYYFPGLFSASQCVLDLAGAVRIFQGCSVNLLRVGVGVKEQEIVCIRVHLC